MTDSDRENLLSRWAEPPSDSEQTRCDNAERVIRNAVQDSEHLRDRDIKVFAQGSYKNNTNVRLNSDVDICVCLMDTFSTDYSFAPNLSDESLGISVATYTYQQFKNDLGDALVAEFGKANVTRGNKAFDIKENTYRVEADVVACIERRRYLNDTSYQSGTTLYPDNGGTIHSWPFQHYDNGVQKNTESGRRFKRLVRVMKNLRNTLADNGSKSAEIVPSFLNECLVWNTPNNVMAASSLSDAVRHTLVHLWQSLETDASCEDWGEVSEMKYLFRPSRPWTRDQARDWILTAWQALEYS
jgi:hypothetical protein